MLPTNFYTAKSLANLCIPVYLVAHSPVNYAFKNPEKSKIKTEKVLIL